MAHPAPAHRRRALARDGLGLLAVALTALGVVLAHDAVTGAAAPTESPASTTVLVPVPAPHQAPVRPAPVPSRATEAAA